MALKARQPRQVIQLRSLHHPFLFASVLHHLFCHHHSHSYDSYFFVYNMCVVLYQHVHSKYIFVTLCPSYVSCIVYKYLSIYLSIYLYLSMHMYIQYLSLSMYTHRERYIYIYTHTYIYIYMYLYIYIYIFVISPVIHQPSDSWGVSDWIAGLVRCPVHAELQRCQEGRADGGGLSRSSPNHAAWGLGAPKIAASVEIFGWLR